jgi:hypothetical protein
MELTNKFKLGGLVQLQPLVKTAESGKRYCNIQVVQVRMAGKDYETEYKRFFNIVSFDNDFIELVLQQRNKFRCVIDGNIGINYGGKQKFGLNLVGSVLKIVEVLDEDFDTLAKAKKPKPEPKPEVKAQDFFTDIDDEELPF